MVLPDNIRVAARGGYVDTVRRWLEADAAHDINDVAAAEDDPRLRGCGLLFSAVQYPFPGDEDNSEAMVSYLVARGADVRHRPLGTGPTPLHLACLRALTGAVRVLVRAGADVNAPFRLARAPANTGDAGRRRVDGAHDGAAPLSLLFNDFLLELAYDDGDDRTTGEVLDDMYACMLDCWAPARPLTSSILPRARATPSREASRTRSWCSCDRDTRARSQMMRHFLNTYARLGSNRASCSSSRTTTARFMPWKSRRAYGQACRFKLIRKRSGA